MRVVSAFQNVPAHLLLDLGARGRLRRPGLRRRRGGARNGDRSSIADIGLRALHAGPIVNSAATEALTSVLISINARYKVAGAGIRITGLARPLSNRQARDHQTMARERQEARLIALGGVPLVQAGDDLCEIILHAVAQSGESLQAGDVLVIAQKIVSKAQGRYVELADIIAFRAALDVWREVVEKDPRVIELILRESTEVLRVRRDVIIVVHRIGFVMANAGIDFSNVAADTAG